MDVEQRLYLLGPVQVERVGQPVHGFESRRALALLCYLAAQGRPQTRAHLADLFWPDKPEARGRGNLSRVLNNLNVLLPGCVSADRETVTFNAAVCWLDISVFDALATPSAAADALSQAITLYRDDFMAGMYLDDCPDFETWLVVERERWRQKAAAALHTLITYHTQRGEIEAGLRYTDRLLALDPWREEAHRHKMLLLALNGQRSAALKQYEACRRMLAEELGVTPTAETEALYNRIYAGAEEKTASGVSEAIAVSLPLVGREADHAWLLAQWEAARRGVSGLTLVSGDAGIGKTRLIHEALRLMAGQGARVLSGRCYEFNRAVPYQALYEALRAAPDNPLSHRPVKYAASDARYTLFAAVAAWLRDICKRRNPCVLFLDDLHWADADTLDLLQYLARHLDAAPCWLVGAYRPGETLPDQPLARLIHALNRDHLLRTRALAPLSADDVAHLTTRLLNSTAASPLAPYLFRESEGNPFFVAELVEMLREQGILRAANGAFELAGELPAALALPAHVSDVILQRVQRLDETGQYLLTLAAAHGRPFDAALLAAAGECPPETVETTLAVWQERQLARPVSGGWDFTHDKIRAALYQTVPALLRRLLHARLAAALETLRPAEVASLAHHYDQARQEAVAARYLRLAGDQARQAYAQEQARDYYRRGLELTADPETRYALLSGLETVCDMASRREEQRAALEALTNLIESGPSGLRTPRHQVELALRQAHYAEATSDYPAAAAAAERAVTLAVAADDGLLVADGYRLWGYALRRQENFPAAHALYEKARAAAERAGAKAVLADSLQGLANVAWNQGHYAAAQTYLEQSLALCQELGDRRGEADAYNILGIVFQRQHDYQRAQEHYTRALELRRAIGDRRAQGLSHNNLGSIAYELGEYAAAEAAYEVAAALCREANDRWGMAIAALGLAAIRLDQGDLAEAQRQAEAALAGLQQVHAPVRAGQAEYVLGRIAQARGEGKTAAERFSAALDMWRNANQVGHVTLGISALAHACAEQGQNAQAYTLLDQALAALEHEPLPTGVVRPARVHLHCYQTLRALGDPRAQTILSRAQTFLHTQAARLPTPVAERFLHQIPEHRALLAGSLPIPETDD